jgi:hypothetical protein
VKLRQLLRAVQRHVRGVDVQHQFLGGGRMAGHELIQQHAMQRHGLRARGPVLQAAEGGRRRQGLIAAHRRLHQQITAQRFVVIQILVAAAQPVQALREHLAQAMADALGVARIGNRGSGRAAQTQMLIDLAQQQQAAVAAQVSAAEVRLDDATTQAAEVDLVLRTLWPRRSSVVCRLRSPLTTRVSTSPLTSCS